MNLFILPSWYPSNSSKTSGLFIRDQVEALANLDPTINVIVSLWGHAECALSIRNFWMWPKKIAWRLRQKSNSITKKDNLYEILNPKITWSDRFPFGGVRQLINVNRRNFLVAQEKFGKIDLIHAHVSYPGGFIAAQLSHEFNVPYVLTEHMGPFPFENLIINGRPLPEITTAFMQSKANIAVSDSLAKRLLTFGYDARYVIPNVVDERRFNFELPSSRKIIFFTLCKMIELKGVEHLLKSIALWNPPASHIEFRIAGDGPKLSKFKAMTTQLGLSDRVSWLGAICPTDVPKMMNECHIFILPSTHETFGVVYAEAIASGKPVIATRCGGPESIINQGNGLLVNVGDIEGLSLAMQNLSNNLSDYDSLFIRRDFENRFSRRAVVDQLKSLYNEVLRK